MRMNGPVNDSGFGDSRQKSEEKYLHVLCEGPL